MSEEKPKEERLRETITLLQKLPTAGIPSHHEIYLEISDTMKEWVKNGLPTYKQFDLFSHIGHLKLPAIKGDVATFHLKVKS